MCEYLILPPILEIRRSGLEGGIAGPGADLVL